MTTTSRPAHPWQRTLRTVVQVTVSLAAAAPLAWSAVTHGDPARAGGAVGVVLAVAAGVCRVMALPAVEQVLRRVAPWLSASDVEAATVVSTVRRDGVVVAGDASPVTTGEPLALTGRVPAQRRPVDAVS